MPRKRKEFYGYSVCFKGHYTTLEQLFGKRSMDTTKMTEKLWKYMQKHQLIKEKTK